MKPSIFLTFLKNFYIIYIKKELRNYAITRIAESSHNLTKNKKYDIIYV